MRQCSLFTGHQQPQRYLDWQLCPAARAQASSQEAAQEEEAGLGPPLGLLEKPHMTTSLAVRRQKRKQGDEERGVELLCFLEFVLFRGMF